MSNKQQEMNEMLSASFDAEQSDIETVQIVDALLNDAALKKRYIRAQLIDDSLHQQLYENLIAGNLPAKIMHCIEGLPAHNEAAVNVSRPDTAKQTKAFFPAVIYGWIEEFLQGISRMLDNKMISGVSVAASVMFATLFSLQYFDGNSSNTINSNIATSPPIKPSLIQLSSESADKSPLKKHLYSAAEPVIKAGTQNSSRGIEQNIEKSSEKNSDLQDIRQPSQQPSYKQATIEINE